jgi:aspartyl-tRNA synthetase
MSGKFITEVQRTHTCGQLTQADIGKEVVLFGWVHNYRDHGGAVFIDLRDREGLTQIVFEPDIDPEAHTLASSLRYEWCVGVSGKVVSRGKNVNPNMKTGEIEVKATRIAVFNRSETPPFLIEDNIDTSEEKRLSHRYLDLRRPALQKSMIIRR